MSKQTQFVSVIKAKIEKYTNYSEVIEDGNVISISDGVAIVSGLDNIMYNELVKFENGTLGIALNLNTDYVGVILLGKHEDIQENSKVVRTKKVVSVPVGDELIGRVINPLGVGIDGKKKIVTKKTMPIEKTAPGVMTRESVNEPLQTGILAIDAMFPIGKGQRELIIGDRQTGKTTIALDTIINQKGKDVKCVYVAIGQKNATVSQIVRTLYANECMSYTTVVSATASDTTALQYIAPYSGMAIAEE
jgi:F-type H+-transporting ATPase subunit alpha